MTEPNPLLDRILAEAESLIDQEHFSLENLCHATNLGLKELGEAMGSVEELVLRLNARFMADYLERTKAIEAAGADELAILINLSRAWLGHALAKPRRMELLLQHRWPDGFERPEWYMEFVAGCFKPVERRLSGLAKGADAREVAAAARGLYALISGLYFLSTNERAKPAGISSMEAVLDLNVSLLVRGLNAPRA